MHSHSHYDNVLHMANVMRGVEMLASTRKNEFDILARLLDLFGTDDPRANQIKDQMFALLVNRQSMSEQISEVKKNLQTTIDLTVSSPSVDMSSVEIDPLHMLPQLWLRRFWIRRICLPIPFRLCPAASWWTRFRMRSRFRLQFRLQFRIRLLR